MATIALLVGVAHNNDRAVRMTYHLIGHRAQDQCEEPAAPARAYDD